MARLWAQNKVQPLASHAPLSKTPVASLTLPQKCRYILKITLPTDYPFKPPDFYMMTPNGRFGVNCKICTTFSSFHPESWTPSYTLTTLLVSFISFFVDSDPAAGAINTTLEQKKQFAKNSVAHNKRHSSSNNMKYSDMLPIFCLLKPGLTTEASLKEAMAQRYPEKVSQAAPEQPKASTSAPVETAAAPKATASGAVDLSAAPAPAKTKKRAAAAASADVCIVLDEEPVAKVAKAAPAPPRVPVAATGGDCVDLT